MPREEMELMLSVAPGALTGISTMMGGLVSINNVFMDMTRQIDASFGLLDATIITASSVVAQFGLKAADAFGQFEQGLKVAQMVSGQTAQEMDYLKQKANEFSVSYRADIDQITAGLQTLGRAGLNSAAEQTEVLENGLSTAKLEGRDLNSVLEELIQNTALLGGNLKSSDFGESSKYLNDVMVATSMTAPITTHDISETLKYSGGIAAAAGANVNTEEGKAILEDYMGAIAAFAQKGVTGSIAGTALRAFFNKPATQDNSVVEALESIHLKPEYLWEDDEQTMKPVSEQIGIIQGQMDELNISTMDRLQIWSKIVGGKMGQQMMKLDSSSIKELTKDIQSASDAESLAAGTFDTYQMKMKEMTEQGQVALRQYGEYAAKFLTPYLEILKKILEVFSNPTMSGALFIGTFSLIASGINKIRNVISLLKTELGAFKNALISDEKLYGIRPSTIRKNERFESENLQRKYPGVNESVAFMREKAIEREESLKKKGLSIEEIGILDASQKTRKSSKYIERAGYRTSNFLGGKQLDELGLKVEDIDDRFIIKTLIENGDWKPEYSKAYFEGGQNFDYVFQQFGDEMVSTVYDIYKNPRLKAIEESNASVQSTNARNAMAANFKKGHDKAKKEEEIMEKNHEDIIKNNLVNELEGLSYLNYILTEDEKLEHPILSKFSEYFDKSGFDSELDAVNKSYVPSTNKKKRYEHYNVKYDNIKDYYPQKQKKKFMEDLEKLFGKDVVFEMYSVDEVLDALHSQKIIQSGEEITLAREAIEEKKEEFKREKANEYADKIIKKSQEDQLKFGGGYSYDQFALMAPDTFRKRFQKEIPSTVDYNMVQEILLKKAGIFTKEEAAARIQMLRSDSYNTRYLDLSKDYLINPYHDNPSYIEGIKDYDPFNNVVVTKGKGGELIYDTPFDEKTFEKQRKQNLKKLNDTQLYLAKYFSLPLTESQARDYVYKKFDDKSKYTIGDKKTGMIQAKISKDILFGPKPGLDDFADIDIGMDQKMSDIIGDKNTKEGRIQLRLEYENFLKWYEETNKEINRLITEELKSLQEIEKSIQLKPKKPFASAEKVTLKELNEVTDVLSLAFPSKTKKEALSNINEFVDEMRSNPQSGLGLLDRKVIEDANIFQLRKISQMVGLDARGGEDSLRKNLLEAYDNPDNYYVGKRKQDLPPVPKSISLLEGDTLKSLGIETKDLAKIPDKIGKKLFKDWDEFKTILDIEDMKDYKRKVQERKDTLMDAINAQIEHDELVKNHVYVKSPDGKFKLPDYVEKQNLPNIPKHEFVDSIDDNFKEYPKQIMDKKTRDFLSRHATDVYIPEEYLQRILGKYGGNIEGNKYEVDQILKDEPYLERIKNDPLIRSGNQVTGKGGIISGIKGFGSGIGNFLKEYFYKGLEDPKTATTRQKLTTIGSNLVDMAGGKLMVAIQGVTMAIQLWQQEYQKYTENLKEASDNLSKAYSEWNSAESSLKQTFRNGNPDATDDEINQMIYDTYATMADDMANAANNGAQEWFKKLNLETDTGKEYEYDEEKDDGSIKEKEEPELTDEEEYTNAVKENTGALYAATAELNKSLDNYVRQANDSWWGLDGWTGGVSDSFGKFFDSVTHFKSPASLDNGTSFTENGLEFTMTASQSDENYAGYTEMAGLMLEDFKDAKGNWIKGLRTMMGEDVNDMASMFSPGTSTEKYLRSMARFSAGYDAGGLTAQQNTKLQASMKGDTKTWKNLAKELAKRDSAAKAGKNIEKQQKKINGIAEKIRQTLGSGFSKTQVLQAAYLIQLQEMKNIADQAIVPIMQTNMQTAMNTLSVAGQVDTNTGDTVNTTDATYQNAAVIAGLVAIIAKAQAKTIFFDAAVSGSTTPGHVTDITGSGNEEANLYWIKKAQEEGMTADKFFMEYMKEYNDASIIDKSFGNFGGMNPIWEWSDKGLYKNRSVAMEGALGYLRLYEATAKMQGYNYSPENAAEEARNFATYVKENGIPMADALKTAEKNYTLSEDFKQKIVDAYNAAGNEDEGSGSSGSGTGDDDKDKGTKKERVDLVLCNKKEIPKLNVNLFKKPPTFTVLNKNFKVRDVKINTEDTPKAIMASIKNAFIDVQKRSDPKIIQDEEAEYDPVAATDGNAVPSGSSRSGTS